MEQEVKQANQMPQEEEIDLVEVVQKLWKNRKLILKITVVFMVLGVLVALFSPKEYTAGCTMVPQSGDKKVGGNLSGLASMVGINLGGASGGEVLSPTIYPKIVSSIPFKKDLMATPLKFEEYDQPITLLDYYTKDEYKDIFEKSSGVFCGIGAYMSQNSKTGVLTIIGVVSGGPAEKAGVKKGDILVEVDGENIENKDISYIVSKVKGKA